MDLPRLISGFPLALLFIIGALLIPVFKGKIKAGLMLALPILAFISLASTVDDIDFSNDGGATYITPTVDANGFDTTSPPINFIRFNPKGEFRGSDGVNNPSMQINFRVRLE